LLPCKYAFLRSPGTPHSPVSAQFPQAAGGGLNLAEAALPGPGLTAAGGGAAAQPASAFGVLGGVEQLDGDPAAAAPAAANTTTVTVGAESFVLPSQLQQGFIEVWSYEGTCVSACKSAHVPFPPPGTASAAMHDACFTTNAGAVIGMLLISIAASCA
jgi:hypothetical protein